MDFSEKAKQFMKVYLTGLDISGDKSIEDVYGHDDFFSVQDNLEYKLLDEIENYIAPRVLDEIEQKLGSRNANSIVEEISDRISSIRRRISEKYDEKEDKARKFSSGIDSHGYEIDNNTEEGQKRRDEVIENISIQIEQDFSTDNNSDSVSRIKRIKEDLMPYFEEIFRVLDVSYMSRNVMDVFDDYELKAKKINEMVLECVDDIKKGTLETEHNESKLDNIDYSDDSLRHNNEIEQNSLHHIQNDMAVLNFCNEIGRDSSTLSDYIRGTYAPGTFDRQDYEHITLGPEEVGVNVAPIDILEFFDGKNKKVYISESMIKESEYGQENIFQGKKYRFYKNERPEVDEYTVLTDDEGKRLELRSNTLRNSRIYDMDKEEQSNSKDQHNEIPAIF